MQYIKSILTSAVLWETIGFVCAISIFFSKRFKEIISNWLNKNNTKIQEDIQNATKLEQDATQLLKQYRQEEQEQQKQFDILKKQNNQELIDLKKDITHQTQMALARQKEATDIHIRLIATQHQQKIISGILDKFMIKTTQHFKKQKTENMDAAISHLFNALEKNPDILKKV